MADRNTVKRRVRSASKNAVYYRNYRRARDRALVRLAQANPAQYKVFLEEERERDKQEGKAWANIAGDSDRVGHDISDDLITDSDTPEGGAGDGGSRSDTDTTNESSVG